MPRDSSPPWLRARFVAALGLLYLALCLAQRLAYVAWIRVESGAFPAGIAKAALKGIAFDAAASAWLFLPVAALCALAKARAHRGRTPRALITAFALAGVCAGLLSISLEFFFWEEFHSRYNFIAVDYLVYTHEVLRNIWESYPVVWFFLALGALLSGVGWALRRQVRRVMTAPLGRGERLAIGFSAVVLLTLSFTLRQDGWLENDPVWAQELAKNSLFALFSAYNANEIDYRRFYVSLEPPEAEKITRSYLGSARPREIAGAREEKHWNVMLVGIESMSARFLRHYGEETKNLTPNLDRMADEGLFLSRVYATGSRTVRGLEALMLSLPPTPGQSILRRPNGDHLFNLGWLFRSRGYDAQFLYGGHAVFDNMGPWFSANSFDIVDKGQFAPGGVRFATAWGACDEDLFDESIRRADTSFAAGKPFFQMLMTTSNHRPYDFPDGRIDLKSHTGRDGAVKYTDYAIGRFVELSRKKPWFKNTLFVFVADHNASVAGGTEIPIRDYLIPVIIYNPALVPAQRVDHLASQIDVAPTLLGLLGFHYRSWFFGQDLLREHAERAFLGTYQKVALLEPGRLTILEPNHRAQLQTLGPAGEVRESRGVERPPWPEEVKRAASLYQTASDVFARGLSKVTP